MDLLFLKERERDRERDRDKEIMTGERESETKSMTGQKALPKVNPWISRDLL